MVISAYVSIVVAVMVLDNPIVIAGAGVWSLWLVAPKHTASKKNISTYGARLAGSGFPPTHTDSLALSEQISDHARHRGAQASRTRPAALSDAVIQRREQGKSECEAL